MKVFELHELAKRAQDSANAIKVRENDGSLEAHRSLLALRDAASLAARQVSRVQSTPVKKLCVGCGDNHVPFMCP